MGKIIASSQVEKRKQWEEEHNVRTIACELALRHIYFSNNSAEDRELVKTFSMTSGCVNGWAMLELEFSDAQFSNLYATRGQTVHFQRAEKRIQELGYPLFLDANTITRRW